MTTVSKLAARTVLGYSGHMQGPQTPKYIVIHGTCSPLQAHGAENTAGYFQSSSAGGLAHYVVDAAEIVACCDELTACWHSGRNANSIGIELVDPQTGAANRWADSPHVAEGSLAAKLVADLCARYKIPATHITPTALHAGGMGICGHNDVRLAWPGCTDHTDPGPDFPWAKFIGLVQAAMNPADKRVTIETVERDTLHTLALLGYGTKDQADALWRLNPGAVLTDGTRPDRAHGLDTYLKPGQSFEFKNPTRNVHR